MNEATRIPQPSVELGASGEEFQNLHELIVKARANLNQNSWDYIVGAAETETTMRRNRMALDEIAFRPRVLRNVAHVAASVAQFGRRMRLPVVLFCRSPLARLCLRGGEAGRGEAAADLRPHPELPSEHQKPSGFLTHGPACCPLIPAIAIFGMARKLGTR